MTRPLVFLATMARSQESHTACVGREWASLTVSRDEWPAHSPVPDRGTLFVIASGQIDQAPITSANGIW